MDLPTSDLSPDPFLEHAPARYSMDVHVLGVPIRFSSDSDALLEVASMAYGGLPPHVLPVTAPQLQVALRLAPVRSVASDAQPPMVRMQAGAGLLCGVMDASNYAVLSPGQGRALVVASPDMLERPYHLRYELIEFCVFSLATRVLGLVPLHGACVGRQGRAVMVMGDSGAGKSTLALHSLLRGMDFLSEDAVFVHPPSGLATGVANYLHVLPDALRFVADAGQRAWIEHSPTIRRRSGVEKYEVDLRHGPGLLAQAPLELAAMVFASRETAVHPGRLIQPIAESELLPRLLAEQPYAASQSGWDDFVHLVKRCGAYELRRGHHPSASVDALLSLLG